MLLSIKEDLDIGERTTGCATALQYIDYFFRRQLPLSVT